MASKVGPMPSDSSCPTEDSASLALAGVTKRNSFCPDHCRLDKVWQEFDDKTANFFADLRIAKDGGLSEVGVLFDLTRFAWATFAILCLMLNLYFLIYPNVEVLTSNSLGDWAGKPEISSRAMILSSIWSQFAKESGRPKPQVILAWLELGMFVFYILRAVWAVVKINYHEEQHKKWHGWAILLYDVVPELSTMSAMKCLHFVTPKVLLPAALNQAKNTVRRGGTKYGLPLLRFVILRVVCALVGFEAFVIKFNIAAKSQDDASSFLGAAAAALAFLNQMLGVVDVNKFAHRRLFVFIFGGSDGFMSDREETVAKTYLAMLAQRIWRATKTLEKKPRWLWFLAVTLSYGDQDFQVLTLREFAPDEHWKASLETQKAEATSAKAAALSSATPSPGTNCIERFRGRFSGNNDVKKAKTPIGHPVDSERTELAGAKADAPV